MSDPEFDPQLFDPETPVESVSGAVSRAGHRLFNLLELADVPKNHPVWARVCNALGQLRAVIEAAATVGRNSAALNDPGPMVIVIRGVSPQCWISSNGPLAGRELLTSSVQRTACQVAGKDAAYQLGHRTVLSAREYLEFQTSKHMVLQIRGLSSANTSAAIHNC